MQSQAALTADTQRGVFNVLCLLTPRDMVGVGKRRIGGNDDGGYVLADMLTPAQPILSLGVGPDVSFDLELAKLDHKIVMFDHTVDALPSQHQNFTWHRLGVAPTASADCTLRSLAELADLLPITGAAPILKMDVEGAEWDVLANVQPATLRRFTQITLELHFLLRLEDDAFRMTVDAAMRNLVAEFVLVHVHGNNCGAIGHVGGFACPDTLEITLVRRDLVTTAPSATWYPTALDHTNWRGGQDYLLWGFPFAPGSEGVELASQQA
jgi:hypothetical protein